MFSVLPSSFLNQYGAYPVRSSRFSALHPCSYMGCRHHQAYVDPFEYDFEEPFDYYEEEQAQPMSVWVMAPRAVKRVTKRTGNDKKKAKKVPVSSENRSDNPVPAMMTKEKEKEEQNTTGNNNDDSVTVRRLPVDLDSPMTWDVKETEGAVVVRAGLPGVAPDAVRLTAERGCLQLCATRQHSDSQLQYHEEVQRVLPLPEGVDPASIEANWKDGVLEVRIPNPAGAVAEKQPVKIAIRDESPIAAVFAPEATKEEEQQESASKKKEDKMEAMPMASDRPVVVEETVKA